MNVEICCDWRLEKLFQGLLDFLLDEFLIDRLVMANPQHGFLAKSGVVVDAAND